MVIVKQEDQGQYVLDQIKCKGDLSYEEVKTLTEDP